MAGLAAVQARLADDRSHHLVVVSHCLLNENARYQGGAFRPGVVTEVVREAERADAGIYQMPCPEQRAWGGVTRRYTLPMYDSVGTMRFRLRAPLTALFVLRCRIVYRRLARRVARDLADFRRAGTRIDAIVGVRGSPSCGVCRTVGVAGVVNAVGRCQLATTNARRFAEEVVVAEQVTGAGMFFRALERQLRRRRLSAPMIEHDFAAEVRGCATPLVLPPQRAAAPGG